MIGKGKRNKTLTLFWLLIGIRSMCRYLQVLVLGVERIMNLATRDGVHGGKRKRSSEEGISIY